jgi:hypothetical protein
VSRSRSLDSKRSLRGSPAHLHAASEFSVSCIGYSLSAWGRGQVPAPRGQWKLPICREFLAPIVISYAKTCDETVGHCVGTAGDAGTFEMQVTSIRATGNAAQLTLTEWITVGDISFTAKMKGHVSPAEFIVLNGTVTEGSFAGAQVHQRSNLVGIDGTTTTWTGELRLMPASA